MASENVKNLVERNEKWCSDFKLKSGDLKAPPVKKLAVVTCMDSRIDVTQAFGVRLGEAHIIRNGGGNAKDALRSIMISQHFLGTREIILVKHTNCGMLTFKNPDAVKKVCDTCGDGAVESDFDFQPFGDLESSTREEVEWLKGHKALLSGSDVTGWIYEVETGKVKQVV